MIGSSPYGHAFFFSSLSLIVHEVDRLFKNLSMREMHVLPNLEIPLEVQAWVSEIIVPCIDGWLAFSYYYLLSSV